MSTNKRDDLQWLRAVAAVEVVVWHSDLATKHFSPTVLQESSYAAIGGIGVELFFIISGFIIAMRAPAYASGLAFLWSRILRLYPMYWVFTSLVLLAGWLNQAWSRSGTHIDLSLLLKSYLILPQQGYPILGVGWTLEHEMLFYLLIACALLAGCVRTIRARLLLGVVMGMLGSIGFVLDTGPDGGFWEFHLVSPYWLAFSLGWLFATIEQQTVAARRVLYASVGIGIGVLAATPLPLVETMLLARTAFAAATFLTFCAIGRRWLVNSWLNRTISQIGDASFSIYLSHTFVLSIVGKLLSVTDTPYETGIIVRLLAVLFCIFCGLLIHKLLELPLDRLVRRPGGGPSGMGLQISSYGVGR